MIINNYFAISFLITLIINILNFETHQCNSTPRFFDYSYDIGIYNLKFLNGSLHFNDYHIHHWLIGSIILIIFELFQESIIKNMLKDDKTSAIKFYEKYLNEQKVFKDRNGRIN